MSGKHKEVEVKNLNYIRNNILEKRMRIYKDNDALALGDGALLGVLDGSRTLTEDERQSVVNSPMTLRRFRSLAAGWEIAKQIGNQPAAANDALWVASVCLLKAAYTDGDSSPLITEDGWWKLSIREMPDGWKLVLQLDRQAPFASLFALPDDEAALLPTVAVSDGKGIRLLSGSLDEEGRLFGDWLRREEPRTSLLASGGFKVELI
jgi:hypothetical protein